MRIFLRVFVLGACLLAFVGCSTSSHVRHSMQVDHGTRFIIPSEWEDPLGVGRVIEEALSDAGHKVEFRLLQAGPESRSESGQGSGSGFFISRNGIFVTNNHVISGAADIGVQVGDELRRAKVLVEDANNDVALLQVIGENDIACLPFSRNQPALGDKIWVIGFPLVGMVNREPRLADGVVSGLSGLEGNPTRIQISAPLNPGSSGSPILNDAYQVIGVASEKLSDWHAMQATGNVPQGMNFGVRSRYIELLFEQLEQNPNNDECSAGSLQDAIAATSLVVAGSNIEIAGEPLSAEEIDGTSDTSNMYLIVFDYSYSWDLFHNTLNSLHIKIYDEQGNLTAEGRFNGSSLRSYIGITRSVMNQIINDF